MRIEAIYVSPVKSLGLQRVERAHVGKHGIVEDRRFFIIGDRDRLVTQREAGRLAQVASTFTLEPELLRLTFPDGRIAEAQPQAGAAVTARFFGQFDVEGRLVIGPWSEALSAFVGMLLRLVRAKQHAFDALPISICSTASVDALGVSSGAPQINERRFRPNFYVSGVDAHGEDAWIGRDVRLGAAATVRVIMRDERCAVTTLDPATGEHDLNTLKMIAAYRTDQPKEVNFGVYGNVVATGEVAVGDEVVPLQAEEKAS